MEKLEGKANLELEDSCYDASGHILINLSSHYKSSLAPKIEQIKRAIEDKRLLRFDYFYPKGESKRCMEPYLLVFEWANWYVCGYCMDRKDFRMFKLNRMLEVQVTDDTFSGRELPPFRKKMEEYFTDEIHLKAKFHPEVKWKLIEEYGPDCFRELDTKELFLEMDFTNKDNLISWILGFGDKVEILEPMDLRIEYMELIKRMNFIYKET